MIFLLLLSIHLFLLIKSEEFQKDDIILDVTNIPIDTKIF